MATIFQRMRLHPRQLRTVAERRFDDARYLLRSGRNARANASMYLAGFVVECLLKAALLEHYRWLQSAGTPAGRPEPEREIWFLCYRSHDLTGILERLPGLTRRLASLEQQGQLRLLNKLRSICSEWTIFARYSPRTAEIAEAGRFIEQIEELKPWLK